MKQLPFLLLTLLSCTAASAQTPSDNPLFRHLPPDADKVYRVNFPAIIAKVDWAGFIDKVGGVAHDTVIANIIADPSRIGIDIHKDIFITETNTLKTDSPRYMTILLTLTDSAKFISFISKEDKKVGFVIRPGKVRAAREGDKVAYAWDDKLAIITIVRPPIDRHGSDQKTTPHTAKPAVTLSYGLLAIRKSMAALKGYDKSPFLTDTLFRNGFSDDADVHTWNFHGSAVSMLMEGMRHTPIPLKNYKYPNMALARSRSRTLGTIRFENGRITYDSKTAITPEDAALLAKLGARPFDTDLVSRLPKGDLLGIASFHFDVDALIPILDRYKSRHVADSLVAANGLTTEEVLKAFKGDLLVAAMAPDKSAVDSAAVSPDSARRPLKPNFFVVTTIGDMPSYLKLAARLTPHSTSDSLPRRHKLTDFHTLKDNILVFGTTQTLADSYFNTPGRGPSELVNEQVRNTPVSIAIDMKVMVAFLHDLLPAGDHKSGVMVHALELLDKITYSGGNVRGNEVQTSLEIKMVDQQKNSLQTLTQIITSGMGVRDRQ